MAGEGQKTQRIYQQIAEKLRLLIIEQGLRPGQRLASERELAETFRVSRASIREALLALELAELVEVRTGSGAYVKAAPAGRAAPQVPQAMGVEPGPHEVLEARRLVEGETAYRAALHASPAQLEPIKATIEHMRIAARNPSIRGEVLSDQEFHLRIAEASGNSVLAALVRELWATRGGAMWNRWIERARTVKSHQMRVVEHAAIYEHLLHRRADAARAAMQHHIDSVVKRFLKY